jgi:ubiquinone/menaquinone biosynthesis C-methylase UbiE
MTVPSEPSPHSARQEDQDNESLLSALWGVAKIFLGFLLVISTISFFVHFPYHADVIETRSIPQSSSDFYNKIYSNPDESEPDNAAEYVAIAREAISAYRIVDRVERFATDFDLKGTRILDVGAGTGYLQDVVENYVGLDISSTARQYFHKPFVQASATAMPFRNGEFDALWSVWVLEHVPKPEQALIEMRRVVRDGGLLYLLPAWNCNPWAAQGYPVRPFSDLGLKGSLVKASLPVVASPRFRTAYVVPTRLVRRAYAKISGRPTRLHYNLLEPNYSHYWMADSDALNSLDFDETMLWFTSRGDECVNCGSTPMLRGFMDTDALIIRVHKPSGS